MLFSNLELGNSKCKSSGGGGGESLAAYSFREGEGSWRQLAGAPDLASTSMIRGRRPRKAQEEINGKSNVEEK